jgi:hypothetical protein
MNAKFLSAPGLFIGAAVLLAVAGATAVTAGASSVDEFGSGLVAAADDTPNAAVASENLTEAEVDGLVLMREEEKLARDVYDTLGDLWDAPIFSNIAASEQRHMGALLGLLDVYGLDDTQYADTIGIFENRELQVLYEDLVSMGSESIEAAFEVGAIIEEVDIIDLEEYLSDTAAEDITRVYGNLLRGSRNHLRSFVSQLEAIGIDRTPHVMEPEAYESILASGVERGGGNGGARDPGSEANDRRGGGWQGSQRDGRGLRGSGGGGRG